MPITDKNEITKFFNDCDWYEAATYAEWAPIDVAEIVASSEGQNDESNWRVVVRLTDGRYSFLSAGCDYTGWDCQAWGSSQEYGSLEELIRMGLGKEDRELLGMPLPEPPEESHG